MTDRSIPATVVYNKERESTRYRESQRNDKFVSGGPPRAGGGPPPPPPPPPPPGGFKGPPGPPGGE